MRLTNCRMFVKSSSKSALRNERVEHLSPRLAALTEETWILGGAQPGSVLFVRLQLPAIFDGRFPTCLDRGRGPSSFEKLAVIMPSSDRAPSSLAVAKRTIRRKPASCCSPQEPLTRAGSAPASPVSTVLSRNLAVPKAMSHKDNVSSEVATTPSGSTQRVMGAMELRGDEYVLAKPSIAYPGIRSGICCREAGSKE